jgi:hypothetical protein
MATLIEMQAPIDREIVNAILSAMPESSDSIQMIVEREEEAGAENLTIVLPGSEDGREGVAATENIHIGLYKLTDLQKEYGEVWRRLCYKIANK